MGIGQRFDLWVSDVDGTLTEGGYEVSAEVAAAMGALTGIMRLAVLTGRSYSSASRIAASVHPTCLVGSCNGGYVVDPVTGTEIHRARYSPTLLRSVDEAVRAEGVAIAYYTPETVYLPGGETLVDLFRYAEGVDPVVAHPPRLGDVVKVTLVLDESHPEPQAARLSAHCGQLVRSIPWIMELTSASACKEAALEAILGYVGTTAERVIGSGDGENDLEWMSRVGYRVVPSGAHPDLVKQASHLVARCEDRGVATFASQFVAGQG